MSRRLGGKEEIISVFERVGELLEKRGISRPSLGQRRKKFGLSDWGC